MTEQVMTGAQAICRTLETLGLKTVFGLPGTQNVYLYEALRQSSLRSITATDELKAGFMANGYYRASGEVAVVTVIPGPGFTYTLTALAEARHDSVPLLFLSLASKKRTEKFQLQVIDQKALAKPLVKAIIEITEARDIPLLLRQSLEEAIAGEPGPVYVEITREVLREQCNSAEVGSSGWTIPRSSREVKELPELMQRLAQAKRPLIYAGQGAFAAAAEVLLLAESLHCPVLTTCSGRGVIPENHPLSYYHDFFFGPGTTIPNLLQQADLVLALGCKLSHNGSAGFRLPLSPDKLIHVDASAEVVGANYPTLLSVVSDLKSLLSDLLSAQPLRSVRPAQWTDRELAALKRELAAERQENIPMEPRLDQLSDPSCGGFFQTLRQALPGESIVVTDSGLHQALTRRYFRVLKPRTLITPSDFQSMGYAIPAAIGTTFACPNREVVTIVGDGSFLISAMELLTAVREQCNLTVIIFNDGAYGLIRNQQREKFGEVFGTSIVSPDYQALCTALGCHYFQAQGIFADVLTQAQTLPGVKVIEVKLGESLQTSAKHTLSASRELIRRFLPHPMLEWWKRRLRWRKILD